jgi:hypothetical protein
MTSNNADQSAVFSFLGDPATHGLSEPVKRIETHGAVVFLAGRDAYKVKRAVRYPYMDFSTLEKRQAACEHEILVNRENAPELYLGTIAITKDAAGLHLGGAGEVVEWTVHLRRFDEEATLDRVIAHGRNLSPQLIASLAQAIQAMHARTPTRDAKEATHALRAALTETLDELRQSPKFVARPLVDALTQRMTSAFDQLEPLLLARGGQGRVRRCHGDLHLRNIVLIDEAPVVFDALEFDDALATSDTLYDLAFLLMDLCERGLRAEANHLLNRYLWCCADEKGGIEGLALLPLFMALRALIRAKVTITQMLYGSGVAREPGQAEVDSYVKAAQGFLEAAQPRVIAIGGLSGTGKTTLASALAPFIGPAPGAVHLRSDIERKRLFGAGETSRLGEEAYTPQVSARVYDRLNEYAAAALGAGRSVVLDATFRSQGERAAAAATAADHQAPFAGIWLEAPRNILLARVAGRRNDASDATAPVVAGQLEQDQGQISWAHLDASQSIDDLKVASLQLIGR